MDQVPSRLRIICRSVTQSRVSNSLFYEGGRGMPHDSITTIGSNIIEYFMFLKTPSMIKDIF